MSAPSSQTPVGLNVPNDIGDGIWGDLDALDLVGPPFSERLKLRSVARLPKRGKARANARQAKFVRATEVLEQRLALTTPAEDALNAVLAAINAEIPSNSLYDTKEETLTQSLANEIATAAAMPHQHLANLSVPSSPDGANTSLPNLLPTAWWNDLTSLGSLNTVGADIRVGLPAFEAPALTVSNATDVEIDGIHYIFTDYGIFQYDSANGNVSASLHGSIVSEVNGFRITDVIDVEFNRTNGVSELQELKIVRTKQSLTSQASSGFLFERNISVPNSWNVEKSFDDGTLNWAAAATIADDDLSAMTMATFGLRLGNVNISGNFDWSGGDFNSATGRFKYHGTNVGNNQANLEAMVRLFTNERTYAGRFLFMDDTDKWLAGLVGRTENPESAAPPAYFGLLSGCIKPPSLPYLIFDAGYTSSSQYGLGSAFFDQQPLLQTNGALRQQFLFDDELDSLTYTILTGFRY